MKQSGFVGDPLSPAMGEHPLAMRMRVLWDTKSSSVDGLRPARFYAEWLAKVSGEAYVGDPVMRGQRCEWTCAAREALQHVLAMFSIASVSLSPARTRFCGCYLGC